MKTNVTIKQSFKKIFGLSLVMLSLVACSNKDSNFASKYQRNASGAQAVSAQSAAIAAQLANATGNDIDVVGFDGPYNMQNNTIRVTSYVIVNNYQFPLTTVHNVGGGGDVSGRQSFGGLDFDVTARCVAGNNSACSTYYLVLNVRKGGQFIIQEGFKKYLPESMSNSDVYQFLDQSNARSFADMVNLLDSFRPGN